MIIDFSRFPVGSKVTLTDLGAAGPVLRFDVTRSERDGAPIAAKLGEFPEISAKDAVATRDFRVLSHDGRPGHTIRDGKTPSISGPARTQAL